MRALRHLVLPVVAAVAAALLTAPAASAVPRPPGATPRTGSNTQMVMSGTGPGQGVRGYIADANSPFDPVADGYPASDPSAGFSPKDEGFAGVIYGDPTDGSPRLTLYCIDILTNTYGGIGYVHGTWNNAEVPNVGYVARLLNSYYPKVPGVPAGLGENEKAAAVQAAIWFFSDRYVLRTDDSLHDTVAGIVAATIAAGPLPTQPPPNLTISPTVQSGPKGSVVGPYTVTSDAATTVNAVGADMFADAAATQPIAQGATVSSGQHIWLRSTGPKAAALQATAKTNVPTGNVYLYDGNTPGVSDAQKLILSQDATLTTTVNAVAEFLPTGSLTVTKTITGGAAGSQGQVTVVVTCGGVVLSPALSIPAGSDAGDYSHTWDDIPAGAVCTVDETHDGHTSTVQVAVTGDGQEVTIPSGETATADLTDTYELAPGSLIVRKSIRGEGAGRQGEVTIHTVCDGTALTPDFVIPAGSDAGISEKQYDDIPAGAKCTITETANGENTQVDVTVSGGGTVTVPAGDIVQADVTDDFGLKPGSLTVDKTIAGAAAGQHGPITITVTCVKDGGETTLTPAYTIPAGETDPNPQTYTDIPGGSICTALEDPDGSTASVAVAVDGSGEAVTIPPGGSASTTITDTYTTGSLVVNKTITGDAAGSQGAVTIHTVCDGTALTPDFVIAAGAAAGSQSHTYPDVLPGSTCIVTETSDGASSTVTVTTDGSGQSVDVSGGGTATADLIDTYDFAPGSLTVTKSISGSSAGDQGEIRIQVDCGEQVDTPDFVIAAGATGDQTHTYDDIPAGTTCTVTEVADGSSSTATVTVTGSPQDVDVSAGDTATADLTDTYTPADGALLITKTITGAAAGKQGEITISVTCGDTDLPDFVIPAGTGAKTVSHAYDGIPAGSSCTVTETSDGASRTVEVTADDPTQSATVPSAEVIPLAITDTVSAAPGTLVVAKRITGAAAGTQGLIGILVLCAFPLRVYGLLIPADTAKGTLTRAFGDIPAGSACLVAEVLDGHNDSAAVTTDGRVQITAVRAAQTTRTRIINTYSAGLANTGPPIIQLLAAALGAIALGALLLVAGQGGRRRRRSRHAG